MKTAKMAEPPAATPEPKKPDLGTIAPKFVPKASPEDKEKAKKATSLSLGLVPGAKPGMASGEPYKNAEATIKAFNDKWAGKTGLSDAQLDEKVADFKQMQEVVNAAAVEEKKHAAEIAAKAKEAEKKAAIAAAAKAAEEAKRAAAANKVFMDGLGISEQQAEGLHALAKMLGKSGKDLVAEFKSFEAKAQSYGYPLSGIETAVIMSSRLLNDMPLDAFVKLALARLRRRRLRDVVGRRSLRTAAVRLVVRAARR